MIEATVSCPWPSASEMKGGGGRPDAESSKDCSRITCVYTCSAQDVLSLGGGGGGGG